MAETNTKDHKENPDGASKETEKINGGEHNGDKKKKDAASSFGQHGRTLATSKSLFATGFAPAINKSHVEKLFSKFGRTDRITDFMQKPGSKPGSRYCFVEYESIESAQKAMDNLDGRMLLRKRLVVKPSHANPSDRSSSAGSLPMNPAKERVLIDKKIAALKKKIKESQGGC